MVVFAKVWWLLESTALAVSFLFNLLITKSGFAHLDSVYPDSIDRSAKSETEKRMLHGSVILQNSELISSREWYVLKQTVGHFRACQLPA